MSKIQSIKAKEIIDSRGKPTIEITLTTNLGKFSASVPSGTSRGKHEAVEKPAKLALLNINKIIAPKLKGRDTVRQKEIDDFLIKLDGTKNKSYLGANSILAVSLVVCRAGAKAKNLALWQWLSNLSRQKPRLPIPAVLMIEGGWHGRGVELQEFMVTHQASTFKERFETGKKIYQRLRLILKTEFGPVGVALGQEGAFTPKIRKTEKVLDLILQAAKETALEKEVKIILDAASSTFFKKGSYYLEGEKYSGQKLFGFYLKLCRKYPISAIEDPFAQDDWQGWNKLISNFQLPERSEGWKMKANSAGGKLHRPPTSNFLVIGDDLTVTNPERIKLAYQKKACNAVVIKPNQIGTVSETIEAVKLAKSFEWKIMVSHRSGETNDDFIADLAVGVGADYIKAGAPGPKERMAKYNRLSAIEKELKK